MPACAESEVIMNENRPKGNQKHIDLSGRIRIEQGLNNGESFRAIARDLNKDPSTISKDVIRLLKNVSLMPLHLYLALIITMPLNRKPMYVRYFMDAEIMSALVNVLTAERQDAAKFVTTISQDSARNLLSLHMYVTAVQRKRTA